jgi:hypothetical protein
MLFIHSFGHQSVHRLWYLTYKCANTPSWPCSPSWVAFLVHLWMKFCIPTGYLNKRKYIEHNLLSHQVRGGQECTQIHQIMVRFGGQFIFSTSLMALMGTPPDHLPLSRSALPCAQWKAT